MDSGLAIRPVATPAQLALARVDPAPARQTVSTELAPSQSVTAAADAGARQAAEQVARNAPTTTRDIIIDSATREVVFRILDVRTRQVIGQVPGETQLRLAAYTRAVQRAIADGKTPTEAQIAAELDLQV
jgi:uncharacterized FlaG/YvyC family protein